MRSNEADDQPGDAELVERMVGGDREAFATLFGRHHRLVYRFCVQMSGSKDLAEDLTQEVFIALARNGASYDPEKGSLSTYLYGIARHLVRRHGRSERTTADVDLDGFEAASQAAVVGDPIEALAAAESVRALRRAILRLPAHYREVVVLCELHGVSYEEAAAIVGCPVGTVRSRLNRARRLLVDKCRAILCARDSRTGKPLSWMLDRRSRMVTPES